MVALEFIMWTVSILCLIPLFLYLTGRIRDPFHPLIFLGTLSFFIAPYRPLTNLDPALSYVSAPEIAYYLVVVGISVLALFIGFTWHARKHGYQQAESSAGGEVFRPASLFRFGAGFIFVGVVTHLFTRTDYSVTGYLRGWAALWMPGFILVLQSLLMDRSNLLPGLALLAIALIPPLDRFFIYGQRGDTFRIAVVLIPLFLYQGKRPTRTVFIPAAIALALVLSVLERTRGMVEAGDAPNRVAALVHVLPSFFNSRPVSYYGTEEFIFGSAMVETVREYGNYNYGRIVADLAVRFFPKELVADKDHYYSPWSRTRANTTTGDAAGYYIYNGAMPTGFAHAFVEFWWLTVLFWGGLGYWIRGRYARALNIENLAAQAYFTSIFVIMLYLITQDLNDFAMNFLYMIPTLWLAYRYSRVPVDAREPAPAQALAGAMP